MATVKRAQPPPYEIVPALLNTFDIHQRITSYLIDNIAPEAWRATPPGGKGRDVAGIAAHLHNVRLMWLKAITGIVSIAKLDATASLDQVMTALDESHRALREVLADALAGDGRIKGFKPDAAAFLGYLIAHESHHRGQMTMLARQAGHPVSQKTMFGMWEWNSR